MGPKHPVLIVKAPILQILLSRSRRHTTGRRRVVEIHAADVCWVQSSGDVWDVSCTKPGHQCLPQHYMFNGGCMLLYILSKFQLPLPGRWPRAFPSHASNMWHTRCSAANDFKNDFNTRRRFTWKLKGFQDCDSGLYLQTCINLERRRDASSIVVTGNKWDFFSAGVSFQIALHWRTLSV